MPPIKGSPPHRWRASAGHQRTVSLAPIRGAARTVEGAAAAAPLETPARAAAQRIHRDSAPHCTWSSSALCWAEETGTRRQERTGWAAASRNQIRAQAGSSPGGWCSMPTELIEEGVGRRLGRRARPPTYRAHCPCREGGGPEDGGNP